MNHAKQILIDVGMLKITQTIYCIKTISTFLPSIRILFFMEELHTYLNFTMKATAIVCFLSNSKGFQNGALSFLLTPSKVKFIGKMYVLCNLIQKVTT